MIDAADDRERQERVKSKFRLTSTLKRSLLLNSMLKRPVCWRDSRKPAPLSTYSRLASVRYLRTRRLLRGRGLKRADANERLKLSRRRNPTSGLKLSPTFRYSARAP